MQLIYKALPTQVQASCLGNASDPAKPRFPISLYGLQFALDFLWPSLNKFNKDDNHNNIFKM